MLPTRVPVEEYTTPDAVTADERMTVDELRRLMDRHGVRHLPVLRGETVVGLVSDRDLRLVSGLSAAEKLQVQAADIMASDPLSVRASTPLDEVALAMSEKKVGSVIVNDDEGRFYGIFTATDALNALIETVRRSTTPGL
ncbi:MAG TPA: CBS domain-containing protein [Rubrivivax sp.]|nr:CBS domain-containing protein [Burkholderiales bacterium]HNT37882.1 CBS domain-containing protein [Rubrivivax sp.]